MTQKATISNDTSGQNTNLKPDNSTKQCVITNEMLEKVATKCDKHSYDQMGKFFGVTLLLVSIQKIMKSNYSIYHQIRI